MKNRKLWAITGMIMLWLIYAVTITPTVKKTMGITNQVPVQTEARWIWWRPFPLFPIPLPPIPLPVS